EILVHRAAQPGLSNPVHASRLGGIEAAEELELAARARFEALQAVDDAVLDGGVVDDIEVQVAQRLEGAPVPAVEHAGFLHVERAGHHAALPAREDDAQPGAPPP